MDTNILFNDSKSKKYITIQLQYILNLALKLFFFKLPFLFYYGGPFVF